MSKKIYSKFEEKLKVGDKVRIREDLMEDDYMGEDVSLFFDEEMGEEYGGRIATITLVEDDGLMEIDLDNGEWFWIAEFFEPVEEVVEVVEVVEEKQGEESVMVGRKLEVGDKVRIRRDLVTEKRYGSYGWSGMNFNSEMCNHKGKVATITSVDTLVEGESGHRYSIDLDNGSWIWVSEFFESVVEEEKKALPFDTKVQEEKVKTIVEGNVKYIVIDGKYTICLDKNAELGIAIKHSKDEYCEEMGKALALYRKTTKGE